MKTRFFFGICGVLLISLLVTTVASAQRTIMHRVSVGGPDVCVGLGLSPGCDKNFSLVAIEYADGTVSGQWTDRTGIGGFHARIDCLRVNGKEAWVSGIITRGVLHDSVSGTDFDLAGRGISVRLRDNGVSAEDPADQISFTMIELEGSEFQVCTEQPQYDLVDIPKGQAVIVE